LHGAIDSIQNSAEIIVDNGIATYYLVCNSHKGGSKMARGISKIGLIIGMVAIASGVVYFSGVAFASIVPQAWGSWSAHVARIEATNARTAKIQASAEENSYAIVCEDYFEASFFEKMWKARNLKWCEKYEDRMPG
jgi:hypothetical protein